MTKTNIKWTSYLATAYAEGFCEGEEATLEEQIEAWAYLIKTKLAYSLQGWFGRTATNLIEQGLIDKDGNVDWDAVEDLKADSGRDYPNEDSGE